MQTNPKSGELQALSIIYYVFGALMALFSFTPLLYAAFGAAFAFSDFSFESSQETINVDSFGWAIIAFGIFIFILCEAVSFAVIITGRFIQKRTHYIYTFVVACLLCFCAPFGTVVGILTIVFLSQDSIKKLYGR